jgi:hypothetical protein
MVVGHMADAEVLDVRVMADDDAIDVAAQDAAEPNARLFADLRVADYPGGIGDEHARADLRPSAKVFEDIAHDANSGDVRCKMQSRFGKIWRTAWYQESQRRRNGLSPDWEAT